jgi:sugar phosphate isomerase/epimerase
MDITRVSTTTFPLVKLSLDDALAVIADAGFKKVDLLEKMPHFSLDPAECDPADVRACAEKRGVAIANLATYVGAALASKEAAEQEAEYRKVLRAIDVAAELGARSIRGFRSPTYDNAEDVPRIAPWIRRCADYAAEKKIYLGMENHGGGISGNPEVCRELAGQVGSPWFGVLYDPCNLWTRGTDYKAGFEVMKDHIVHVHLKDGTSENASQKTTMLGEGDIEIPWLLDALESIGYEGDIALEYEVETVPPETGLKQWLDTLMQAAGAR